MPMGEHETGQISPHLFDEAHVRDDEIYPREIGARERHPAIDHQPFQVSLAAKTVKREVHADFAQASKRHEDELVISFVHLHQSSSAESKKASNFFGTCSNDTIQRAPTGS